MRAILCFFLCFQLGCATIINGSTEKIEISVGKADSKVYINDILIGVTQADVPLNAEIPKKGAIDIKVIHENCDQFNHRVQRQVDPLTFLGLLIDGGIFSIIVVDILATNAFVKASQNYYHFELSCNN
jgi:hypothetical protein